MSDLTELPPLNETRFTEIRVIPETGSTNADLIAEALAGRPEGIVLATDHQTAGRGRQQRAWHDDPGNALLVSVLLRPKRSYASLMPLLTGLAAVEAVKSLAAEATGKTGEVPAPVGLKWPNDVLAPGLDERKVAGILAESATTAAGGDDDRLIVVVGMGMNLRWGKPPPTEIAAKAATLGEVLGRSVERDEILHRYLRAFEYWLKIIEQQGSAVVLDAYRRCCLTIGRQVRFATSQGDQAGLAADVSSSGLLILETAAGKRVELAAGDAHHVGPPNG